MQILSEQRLNEIMSVFKFFGSIANDHRLPLPNQQTGEDSYSSNLYSTFSRTPPARARFIGSFRFFSEKFAALLILLLRATAKNEGIPEGQAACEEIEPRRQYENVELDFRRHSFDWGLEQVDDLNVLLIVHLVIVLLQGRPLNAERMHWLHRRELLRDGGILDPCAPLYDLCRSHSQAPHSEAGPVTA